MSLPEKPRALVTGAGSGLGRAMAVALGRRGGRVLVTDIQIETAEATARLVVEAGGQAEAHRADVSKKEEVYALPARMKERFGGTDLVVNNAGVAVGGPVTEVPLGDWEWLMGINLWGVIYGSLAFLPDFVAQGSGHFLNVASAAGLISGPRLTAYHVAKAGVVSLSESMRVELAPKGIGVTVLCPSFVKTNIHRAGRNHGKDTAESAERLMDAAKLTADDVGEAAIVGCEKNVLYVVPHAEARWAWRLKRADPEAFYKHVVPRVARRIESGDPSGGAGDAMPGWLKKILNKDG